MTPIRIDLTRTRIGLAWLFVFVFAFYSRQYPALPGVALCFVGATIRFWSSGYLRKDARPAVGGPYAWVRNPLYLGTYVMALGAAWSIGNLWLLGTLTVVFAALYHFVILAEEVKLREIFGAPYLKYCELVPRFFPRPWPASRKALKDVNPEADQHRFSWALANKNRAYEAYVSFAGIMLLVILAAHAWQRFFA